MNITNILIEDNIKEKIFNKHNVEATEIKQVIFTNPLILKVRKNRYMAIWYYQRHLTIIFEIYNNIAFIITAYPSSEAQVKLYKKKK